MKNFNLSKEALPWSCSEMFTILFLVIFELQANAQTAVLGDQQTKIGGCPLDYGSILTWPGMRASA